MRSLTFFLERPSSPHGGARRHARDQCGGGRAARRGALQPGLDQFSQERSGPRRGARRFRAVECVAHVRAMGGLAGRGRGHRDQPRRVAASTGATAV